ncbi:MAG: phosphoglycolate phosphatase [Pseudomonadota bacterium]
MPDTPLYADCTLVFDLDGTLVDTAPDLTAALNHVLAQEGYAPLPLSEVRNLVGHGARALIERGMGLNGRIPSGEDMQRMFGQFIDYYGQNIATNSTPFPGVARTLEYFRSRRARMGVCTNKPEALSHALLHALDMHSHFTAILGSDSLTVRKPDPAHLLETIRRAGGDPARAVLIGDSAVDLDTARAAKIPVVGVSFGYSQTPMRELGAEIVIDSFDRLIEVLPEILPVRS